MTKPDYVCPVSYPSSVGSLTAGEDKVMPTELLKRAGSSHSPLPKYQHLIFFTGWMPFCHPTNSVEALDDRAGQFELPVQI